MDMVEILLYASSTSRKVKTIQSQVLNHQYHSVALLSYLSHSELTDSKVWLNPKALSKTPFRDS